MSKQVKDLIDGVYDENRARQEAKSAKDQAQFDAMDEKQVAREIKRLEKAMVEHARNLEFEKAAQVRDQLASLKQQFFGSNGSADVVPFAANRAA